MNNKKDQEKLNLPAITEIFGAFSLSLSLSPALLRSRFALIS